MIDPITVEYNVIYKDQDGEYHINLPFEQILLLYAGVIPYLTSDVDPAIQGNQYLWIDHLPHENEDNPQLDSIPCHVLSIVKATPDLYLITVQPDEIDLDMEEQANALREGLRKTRSILRTELIDQDLETAHLQPKRSVSGVH